MSDINNKKDNIFNKLNFEGPWQDIEAAVKDACERYWEEDIKVKLFAVNSRRTSEIRNIAGSTYSCASKKYYIV